MLYHYFGNKEALFLAVLERAYAEIRKAERALQLHDLAPREAMERLVRFTFGYFIAAPHFVPLLNSENLHRARHLRRSKQIREMHSAMIDMIRDVLRRGVASGAFRDGVDPMQLFISMTGVGYFYFSNIHTLSTIFGRDLTANEALAEREAHVVDVILGYLRP
jgi:AcrR family transcriptional regulator